jgi:hypothetical protein
MDRVGDSWMSNSPHSYPASGLLDPSYSFPKFPALCRTDREASGDRFHFVTRQSNRTTPIEIHASHRTICRQDHLCGTMHIGPCFSRTSVCTLQFG